MNLSRACHVRERTREKQCWRSDFSAVGLEVFPEDGPGLAQVATDKHGVVAANRGVPDAVPVRQTTSQLAGRKVPIHEVAVLTNHDRGLWRRIAVAAHPVGVHPADGPWQTVGWAIKVDGAILSFITRQ